MGKRKRSDSRDDCRCRNKKSRTVYATSNSTKINNDLKTEEMKTQTSSRSPSNLLARFLQWGAELMTSKQNEKSFSKIPGITSKCSATQTDDIYSDNESIYSNSGKNERKSKSNEEIQNYPDIDKKESSKFSAELNSSEDELSDKDSYCTNSNPNLRSNYFKKYVNKDSSEPSTSFIPEQEIIYDVISEAVELIQPNLKELKQQITKQAFSYEFCSWDQLTAMIKAQVAPTMQQFHTATIDEIGRRLKVREGDRMSRAVLAMQYNYETYNNYYSDALQNFVNNWKIGDKIDDQVLFILPLEIFPNFGKFDVKEINNESTTRVSHMKDIPTGITTYSYPETQKINVLRKNGSMEEFHLPYKAYEQMRPNFLKPIQPRLCPKPIPFQPRIRIRKQKKRLNKNPRNCRTNLKTLSTKGLKHIRTISNDLFNIRPYTGPMRSSSEPFANRSETESMDVEENDEVNPQTSEDVHGDHQGRVNVINFPYDHFSDSDE